MTLCLCTAGRRQDRVYQAALQLLLHRNGPQANLWGTPIEYASAEENLCIAFALHLEAKVETALNLPTIDGPWSVGPVTPAGAAILKRGEPAFYAGSRAAANKYAAALNRAEQGAF